MRRTDVPIYNDAQNDEESTIVGVMVHIFSLDVQGYQNYSPRCSCSSPELAGRCTLLYLVRVLSWPPSAPELLKNLQRGCAEIQEMRAGSTPTDRRN